MAGLGTLIQALIALLPPWAVAAIGVAGAVWLVRGLRFRTRTRRIRELVRRRVRAEAPEAAMLLDRALDVAGDDPALLGELARESRRRTQPDGWRIAEARLVQVSGGPAELARVRRLDGPEARALDAHEEADRVANLVEQGLPEAARARLDEARARFPDDPRLHALAARIAGTPPEPAGSAGRIG